MLFNNVIVDVTICRRMFSQLLAKVSAGLTNVSGLAVAAFDLFRSKEISS